ncbi:PAS domain S-box protein [Acuticoccus sp. M5D2P5]|uniref:hybrid sensor histidine kinase/response regulator n=1 Tax=Acuticoccus kalidii TaxID=2910977 RepID=UPI001F28BF4B|nr:PAS domain-containing sensor histidine kinase [Acuticoccus kalidii]MCF3932195.1 PAS domain S-box protein [Acuticoccus kalidii]
MRESLQDELESAIDALRRVSDAIGSLSDRDGGDGLGVAGDGVGQSPGRVEGPRPPGSVGAFWLDARTGSVQLSRDARDILGRTSDKGFQLDDFLAAFDVGERDALRADIGRAMEIGIAIECERRLAGSSQIDAARMVQLAAMPVRDGAGEMLGFSGHVRALSSPAASSDIEANPMAAGTLADVVPVKVWIADLEGRTERVNQRLADFLGLTSRTAEWSWANHIHPADLEGLLAMWDASKKSGVESDCECRLKRRDGRYRWHKLRIIPMRGADGAIEGWYGGGVDIDELKAAEARTRELTERLTVTLGSINDGLATYDRNWRCTYMNRVAGDILGIDAVALIGKNVWEEFPQAVGGEIYEAMHAAARSGRRHRLESTRTSDGRWFDITMYPFRDGVTVMFRDVTIGQLREERLRLLEAAVANMHDMVVITTVETSAEGDEIAVIYVNEAYETITGFRADAVSGLPPSYLDASDGLVSPDKVAQIRASMARGEPVRTELYLPTAAGEAMCVDLFLTPIEGRSGKAVTWVAVLRDQTERKRNEALAGWQAWMLDRAHDAIVVCDLDGSVTYWNKRAEQLYGWTAAEAIGKPMKGLLGAGEDGVDTALAATQSLGHWAGRLKHVTREGKVIQVGSNWSLIPPTDEHDHSILTINVDITQRILLDEEFMRMQRLEAIGKMTGGIAHDFNNLLTIILGSADMINRRAGNAPEIVSLAGMSRSAAERGRDLVRRLLAFARRQQLDPVPTDINQALDQLAPMLAKAVHTNVEFELDREGGLWLAEIDPGRLEDALINLSLNASDAMQPNGGRIVIETRNIVLDGVDSELYFDVVPGEYVMIGVSDNGAGMDAEVQRRVFEPFFTTKGGRGSGLGLSMVYGFMKQSGGHIKIYSEVGQGTVVRLWLPRSKAVSTTATAEPLYDAAPNGTETLLLVEDDPSVRYSVSTMLESLGYTIVQATRAEEAITILRERGDIDMLFTDVIMPGAMNGMRLAELIREQNPNLPILFTSGYSKSTLTRQFEFDANMDLLSKPYRVSDLAQTVRRLFDRPD